MRVMVSDSHESERLGSSRETQYIADHTLPYRIDGGVVNKPMSKVGLITLEELKACDGK